MYMLYYLNGEQHFLCVPQVEKRCSIEFKRNKNNTIL